MREGRDRSAAAGLARGDNWHAARVAGSHLAKDSKRAVTSANDVFVRRGVRIAPDQRHDDARQQRDGVRLHEVKRPP